MTRAELDRALDRIRELWVEVDSRPRPETLRREVVVRQAVNILQHIADEFDAKRS
jgi:hypothetical protein